MAEGRARPRGEQFSQLNSQLSQAVGHFTQLISSATAFGQAIGQFKALETQLALTNAAAGGTAETFERMGAASRQFAFATTASAQEAASALFYLAQAGYSVEQSMNALPGVMILAQATMQDVAFTSDLLASTLMTYQLTSLDTTRVANLFAAAQMNSLASLDKLAFSLRQIGPVASAMGQELEKTTAFLAELYNVGLRGEQAGTALRNVMVRLAKPVGAAATVLNKYGIATVKASGEARELEEVLQDLYKAGLSNSEAVDLFGVEALAGGLALVRSVGDGLWQSQLDAISNTNAAFDMAMQQMNTLDGAMKQARNAINDVFITLGEAIAPVIADMAITIRELVISFNELDPATRRTMAIMAAAVVVFTGVMAAVRTLMFAFGPLIGMLARIAPAAGAAGSSVGLLTGAMIALNRALAVMSLGAATSLTGLGAAAARAVPLIGNLTRAVLGMNLISFGPLLAGIGGVVAAIGVGVGAGLIYAIYKVGQAWVESNAIAKAAIEEQRQMILDAAGVAPDMSARQNAAANDRDRAASSVRFLPAMEQMAAYAGLTKQAEVAQRDLQEARDAFYKVTDGLMDFNSAYNQFEYAQSQVGGIRGTSQRRASLANVDFSTSFDFIDSLMTSLPAFIERRYSPEALEKLQAEINQGEAELSRLETALVASMEAGNEERVKSTKQAITDLGRTQAANLAEMEKLQAGSGGAEELALLQRLFDVRTQLEEQLARRDSSGRLTPGATRLVEQLRAEATEILGQLAAETATARDAALKEGIALADAQNTATAQSDEFAQRLMEAAFDFTKGLSDGTVDISEIVNGSALTELQTYLKDPAIASEFANRIADAIREGRQFNLQLLLDTLAAMSNEDGAALPENLGKFVADSLNAPVQQMMVAIATGREETLLNIAKMRAEANMLKAELESNMTLGLDAVRVDAVLDEVASLKKNFEEVSKRLSESLGEGWMGITLDADVAQEILDAQGLAGETLGQLLNFDTMFEGVAEAAANGASGEELQSMVDAKLAEMDLTIQTALLALEAQLIAAGASIEEASGRVAALRGMMDQLLEQAATLSTVRVANAVKSAGSGNRFKPPKAKGGGGKGGKSAKDEARKLKEDFEKELRSIEKELMQIERDVLQFDNTIDLSARFTAMLELDRKEISMKYDQRIQEIKSDIEKATADFAKQPAYLGQLITGYNDLITQLERAKQAELDYTNSFTYQSKVRNEAIDRQIDAIRNLSMEGERAGVAILQGIQAGFLQYQKDMKTTVDNVATATVGVLDGLADAVGAFVTGTGDAMDILRNAVLNSLNQLVVDATKRMMQTMLESITGGGLTGGLTGAGQAAGAAGGGGFWSSLGSAFGLGGGKGQAASGDGAPQASALVGTGEAAQMQVVLTTFITQFQTVLTTFLTQLQALVSSAVAAMGGQMGEGGIPGIGGMGGQPGISASPAAAASTTGGMEQQMGGFMSSIMGMFQSMIGGLGSMLSGLFSSLLGGLGGGGGFLGLFDSGGNIGRGKWGIAGEFGPEIIKGPASVVGREDTMDLFRRGAERANPEPPAPPVINNLILQDQSVVARYLSTSAGKRQIGNLVRQTQNPGTN